MLECVSEQSVENKLAQVKLGVTTKAEIESLLGNEHGAENLRWIYNLSDTALGRSRQYTGLFEGFPITVAPINTRALITVRFTESGTVNGLEVARFFNHPFTNDYWYLIKGGTENILESAAHAGETSNFRVVGFDKSADRFALEDDLSKARITVTLEKQTLHITSINPHGQVTQEYRVFTKRESALIDKISALTAETIVSPPTTPQLTKTAHLSWKNNSGNEKGFRIYRTTGNQKIKIAELGPNITAYIDKDAPPKACYVVTAFNSAGESSPTDRVCLPE
jgi:hypothetical protein